jgi:acyl-CoA synthetase (AMP-forming)/AMP-acid ligase II
MNYLLRQPWREARRFYDSQAWTTDTIPGLIRSHAAKAPDQIATVDSRRSLTYANLAAAMERAAGQLTAVGVDRGDAVLIRLPDSAEFVAAAAAAHAVGAVAIPVAASSGELEIATIVERVHARAYAGVPEEWSCLAGLRRLELDDASVWVPGAPPGTGHAPDPDALMEVMFTSGTTGRAKGVMNSANTKLAGLRGFRQAFDLSATDVVGVVAPMHHNAGWGYSYLLGLYAGGTAAFVGRGDPERMLDTLAREGVTTTFLVPTHASDLLAAWRAQPGRWNLALRYVLVGGSTVPSEVVTGIRDEWGAEPIVCYGMTEGQSVSFTRDGDPIEVLTESVGRPCPGVDVAVRSAETGHPVDEGGVGEVVISGPTVCLGYYDDQAATSAAFTKDGWLRSGDLGTFVDGNLRIVGRLKEVILRGGATVVPEDVEVAIAGCPGVEQVSVCAVPDERLGELICACVVGDATLQTVQDHLRARGIGRGLWPDAVLLFDDIPKTSLGKVRRAALAAAAAERCGRSG